MTPTPDRVLGRMRGDLLRCDLRAAFRDAELALDACRPSGNMEVLLYPLDSPAGTAPPGLWPRLYGRLARGAGPWASLWRAYILHRTDRAEEALREAGGLARLTGRYGWMRFLRGRLLLQGRAAYPEAEREFQAAVRSAPGLWKARAFMAESALCRGQRRRAFRIFDRVLRGLAGSERAQALAWRGELRLWLGEYRRALEDLEEGVLGGAGFALCWRGAAQLLLGRTQRALQDLDLALRAAPADPEALIWRGEARHRAGRWRQAVEDLDAAVRQGGGPFWALADRALARARLGDVRGMWSDLRSIRPDVLRRFERGAGLSLSDDPRPETACAVLEAGLTMGRGVRRSEPYLFPIWMRRS